jgi:hypothetical protein
MFTKNSFNNFFRLLIILIIFFLFTPGLIFSQETKQQKNSTSDPTRHHEVKDDDFIPVSRDEQGRSPAYKYTMNSIITTQVNVDATGQNIVGDAANEPSIAVDPNDRNKMVIGWRQFNTVSSNFRQAGYGYTTNGGQTWTFPGVIQPGFFRSDPVLDYDVDGNFYYNSLTNDPDYYCKVFKSSNGGSSWDNGTDAHGGDKQWMTIDKTSGPGNGHIYAYWTSSFSTCYPGFFTRSTDNGTSFENCITIPDDPSWGTLMVGSNGNLFIGATSGSTFDFVVARSSNAQISTQMITWDYATNVSLDGSITYGIGPNPGGLGGQTSLAVDTSNSAYHGNVYLLCSVDRNSISDPADVMFARSTNEGISWSSPIRVNDDISNSAYQWFGTMSVAPTGRIDVIWLDTRDHPGSYLSALYYSNSFDGGVTWSQNERLSDYFDPHVGWPQQNKMGDYFHMVSDSNGASLAWAATFNNEQDVYYSYISTGPPCTVGLPTNPSPVNGATDVGINLPQVTWTNGAGATQIEVFFDGSSVYSGAPVTSYNIPSTLDYSTTYSWRVNESDGSCTTYGPNWTFTTIPDPNIVIETVFCEAFEGGLAGWTVTNDGGSSGCVWQIRFAPFPNTYTLPPSSTGGIMTADVDECGSGTTLLSTATLNQTFDLSVYTSMVWIEFDNDWNVLDAQDEAHVEVSTNGGTSWIGVWDKIGTDISNTHEVVDITSIASGQSNVKFRLRSVQPGWDWWWVLDNFCIYGEYSVPVELTSFTANAVKDGVELNWITATETNNQGFNIERKNSVGVFENIGYVAGFGTTTEPKSYSYIDSKLETGNYTYRLKQINFDGSYEYSNEVNVVVELPMEYSLDQNYPNPFNPSTTIKYSIAEDGFVKLAIYNMLGEEVTTIVNTTQKAGKYEVSFNARNLASGVYVYRIEAANFTASKKLMLMK